MNIATLLWAMKIERKKDASGRLVPLDVDNWVDVGLVVLAVFITYCLWMLTRAFLQTSGPV